MSSTPGPARDRRPRAAALEVPGGNTVSRWPTIATQPSGDASAARVRRDEVRRVALARHALAPRRRAAPRALARACAPTAVHAVDVLGEGVDGHEALDRAEHRASRPARAARIRSSMAQHRTSAALAAWRHRPPRIGSAKRAIMKRFKAAIIGGSGYGAGEIIRRLLLHPDVELVRVASIDYVGESLSRGAPEPRRADRSRVRGAHARPRPPRACDVVLLGLPHKVSAGEGAGDPRERREDRRPVRRLPPPRRRPPTRSTTAPSTRAPSCSRALVYGLPELNREAITRGRSTSPRRAASRRRSSSALLPLAKARAARRRGRDGRHHRLVRQRRRAAGGHAPPGARAEPQDVQAARAPAHPRDRADARARRRQGRRASTSSR